MNDNLHNVINPRMLAPRTFTQTAYLQSGGTRVIIDSGALEGYLKDIVETINANAANLKDTADFITWVSLYKPNIIPEYRAHMVGERLTK